jgi:DNA-binding CsgD family transcriptional regulator
MTATTAGRVRCCRAASRHPRRAEQRVPGGHGPARAVAGKEISAGELKVLRYLPANLSRHEIAAGLPVSVNTVSAHIRGIYGGLRVSDRSSAVQRARELRLLAVARQESRTANHRDQVTAAHLDGRQLRADPITVMRRCRSPDQCPSARPARPGDPSLLLKAAGSGVRTITTSGAPGPVARITVIR